MSANLRLAEAFLAAYPKNAARVFEGASAVTSAELLSSQAPAVVAGTLRQMPLPDAAAVLSLLPVEFLRRVLSELAPGVTASMLRSLDPTERERILAAVPGELERGLRAALYHPEGSAGSLMDSNALTLPADISVGEARRRVRKRSRRTGNYLYVVDDDRKPVGAVNLGELMVASPKAHLTSLTRSPVVTVSTRADTGNILAHPGWRALHALPVVDAEGILVGILRRETCERLRQEVAERESTGSSGIGLALAELFWTLSTSLADELGRAIRPERDRPRAEEQDEI